MELQTPDPDYGAIRKALACRLREVREDLYGQNGGPLLASAMKVSYSNWVRYESGRGIPGELILRFIEVTAADERWLLTGDGPKYSSRPRPRRGGS